MTGLFPSHCFADLPADFGKPVGLLEPGGNIFVYPAHHRHHFIVNVFYTT